MRSNVIVSLAIAGLFCLSAGPVFSLEILDPAEVEYSTYLGGTGADAIGNTSGIGGGGCIAVDSALCAYVVGSTSSLDFPTVNPYQEGSAGSSDVFVAVTGSPPATTTATARPTRPSSGRLPASGPSTA